MAGILETIALVVLGSIAAGAITTYSRKRQAQDHEGRTTSNVFEVGFRWRGPEKQTRWKSGTTALAAGPSRLRINQSTLQLDLATSRPPTARERILIDGRLRIVTGTDQATGAGAEVALFRADLTRLAPENSSTENSPATEVTDDKPNPGVR